MRRLSALLGGVGFSLWLASACGGDTDGPRDGSAGAGSPGTGGRGSSATGGRAVAVGGTPSTGGAPAGGASTGGAAGEAGGGGVGPALGDECTLPPESGPCNAYFPSYYHDAATGLCVPFVYGGCNGNANRYDSLAACQAACSGGSPDYDACETSSECVVTDAGCCAACEPVAAENLIAVHLDYSDDVHEGCDVACGPCPGPDPSTLPTSPNFFATCENEQCTLVDLRETEISACTDDDDCHLRGGARCCESCDASAPVAVSDEQALREQLECPADLACPPCVPVFDPSHRAACHEGRCVVEIMP